MSPVAERRCLSRKFLNSSNKKLKIDDVISSVLIDCRRILFIRCVSLETISGVDDQLGEMFLNEEAPSEQQIHVCKKGWRRDAILFDGFFQGCYSPRCDCSKIQSNLCWIRSEKQRCPATARLRQPLLAKSSGSRKSSIGWTRVKLDRDKPYFD